MGEVTVTAAVTVTLSAIERKKLVIGLSFTRVMEVPKRPLRCYKCKARGHAAAYCSVPVSMSGLCFKCGKPGHFASFCKEKVFARTRVGATTIVSESAVSLSAVAGPNAGPGPNALPSDKRACSSENIPMECAMDVDQSESSRQVALASGRWQAPQNYGLSSFVCAKSEDSQQFLEPHPALSMLLAANFAANFNARVHDWIWKILGRVRWQPVSAPQTGKKTKWSPCRTTNLHRTVIIPRNSKLEGFSGRFSLAGF
ncbi:hypothetical protein M0804_014943 [Polistes exclamans]|nr:hypothetical protein M0804_014943 [Polistes exclamans]